MSRIKICIIQPRATLLVAFFAWLAFCLTAPMAVGQTTLSSFTISTTPTGTVLGGGSLQITTQLTGIQIPPTGSVDAFTSSNSNCTTKSVDLGTQVLATNFPTAGASTTTFYPYPTPVGTYYVCATYIPDATSLYAAATTNPGVSLTAYANTAFTVQQQNYPLPGQPVPLTIGLSTPAGQPAPTGTITITDANGIVQGTATATASGISPNPLTVTLTGGNSYTASYSGDSVYASQTLYLSAYFSSALVSVSPSVIPAGSPATTITVNGNGFSPGATVQITNSSNTTQTLATTFVSANQLTALVPQAFLANAQLATVQVLMGAGPSNSVNLDIYAQQATGSAVSISTPTSVPYGQVGTAMFGATVSPTVNTSLGFPTGTTTFTVTGPGGSTTQLALGSATLAASGGSGTFQPGRVDTAADVPPTRALTADLNGDGMDDIVSVPPLVGEYPPPYLQVFLATKANSFQSEVRVPVDCSPNDFAVGDINGDGKPDLVVLCAYNTGFIATYMLGNGDGTFQAPVPFLSNAALTSPDNIVIGDFNGDGVMDVALVDGYDGQLQVFTGGKTFGTFTPLPVGTFTALTNGTTPVSAADFNHDGKSDLVIMEQPYQLGVATLVLLTSNGDGSFSSQVQPFTTTAAFLQAPVVTDVNGDGFPDVAVADPGSTGSTDTGQVLVFENNGSGALSAPISYAMTNVSMIAGVPFPVVGTPSTTITQPWSLFAGAVDPTTGTITINGLAVANGAFTPVYTGLNGGYDAATANGTNLLVAGDFNGNGFDDMAVIAGLTVSPTGTSVMPFYYSNTSTATFTGSTQQPNAGTYNLTATYNGDVNFATSTSLNYAITITQAKSTATLTGTATSYFGLNTTYTATVTGVPTGTIPSGTVTFYANGAAISGAVPLIPGAASATAQFTTNSLAIGNYTIDAVYSGDTNYLTANSNSVPTQVQAGSILTSIQPASGNLGDPATTITLTGAGFLSTSVAQFNGAALTTTYVSPTTLRAVIPASSFTTVQSSPINVATPGEPVSAALPFNVIAPVAQATFTGPARAVSASQPTLNFQFGQAYPVAVTATFTLSVQPSASGGATDPAVQFAGGGSTYAVTIPANSTAPVPVQLQTGTIAATITVTVTLTAGGTDITPTSLQPVVIQVPSSPPTITSVTLARNGKILIVTVLGYSSTREVQSADFHFTAASGSTLLNPDVTVQLSSVFSGWYSQAASNQFGSAFSYTQSFTLNQDASNIGSVSVTLTNTLGSSNTESAH